MRASEGSVYWACRSCGDRLPAGDTARQCTPCGLQSQLASVVRLAVSRAGNGQTFRERISEAAAESRADRAGRIGGAR